MQRIAHEGVTAQDRVYCDYQAYYAVKGLAQEVYLPGYPPIMSDAERASITVLVVGDDNPDLVSGNVGAGWREVSLKSRLPEGSGNNVFGRKTARLYSLKVYRRRPSP